MGSREYCRSLSLLTPKWEEQNRTHQRKCYISSSVYYYISHYMLDKTALIKRFMVRSSNSSVLYVVLVGYSARESYNLLLIEFIWWRFKLVILFFYNKKSAAHPALNGLRWKYKFPYPSYLQPTNLFLVCFSDLLCSVELIIAFVLLLICFALVCQRVQRCTCVYCLQPEHRLVDGPMSHGTVNLKYATTTQWC